MYYFDNAATSWPKPEVVYTTNDRVLRQGGSAGRGAHTASLEAAKILFNTRGTLSRLFGIASSDRIVFTQNITESLNIGLQGLLHPGDHVLISSVEHNAVVRPLEYLKQKGVTYTVARCEPDGYLNPETLRRCFQPNTKLVCCTHASNVYGTIMPLKEIGQAAKDHGCLFMVDSAQTAGVIRIDAQELQIDFLAFTGHKGLMGPQGAGGFYLKPGIALQPLLYGGTGIHSAELAQPDLWPEGMESGTRNVPAIAALGAAVEFILAEGLDKIRSHETRLMATLLTGLKQIPGTVILGSDNPQNRVGLVSCVFAGHNPDQVAFELDRRYGIVTRSGLHCAPLAHQTAGTMAEGALRISLNYFQTEEDIRILLEALNTVIGG